MIKRLTLSLVVMLGIIVAVPHSASAHVLKIDGSIGAVLHINPDDNPMAGRSTDYIISFADDSKKFSLPTCDCTVSFINNGKTIATKPLAVTSDMVSEDQYTFATPAVYTMRFHGTPKTPGAFQPFTLDYEERVTGGQIGSQPMPPLLWIGIGMTIGLILLAAFSVDTSEPTKKESS